MSVYYYYNNINENVDFKFSTCEAFLELKKVKEEKNVYPMLPVSMNCPFLIALRYSLNFKIVASIYLIKVNFSLN